MSRYGSILQSISFATITLLIMGCSQFKVSSSTAAAQLQSANLSTPTPTPSLVGTTTPSPIPSQSPAPTASGGPAANCGMQTNAQSMAYCDTFDNPYPIVGRSGQMDNTLWGVSRVNLGLNFGFSFPWAQTIINACGNIQTVFPENDIQICNGQLRESTNDNFSGGFEAGGVIALTMYPKQQFDFANRTGTVAFDVSNDTAGTHSAWPEFWITDLPVPNPFTHFGSDSLPQNGLAVRFAGECPPGEACGCPTADPTHYQWTVDSAAVMRDWRIEDTNGDDPGSSNCNYTFAPNDSCVQTGMTVTTLDCVQEPDITAGPNGGLNHVELNISQDQIDVYATDAGKTAPLKHIAVIKHANLTFSRGFIWLEDAHYNADKGDPGRPSLKIHTFAWDNVAFDGPILPRDLSFDVNDSLTPTNNSQLPNAVFLGWDASPTQPAKVVTQSISPTNLSAATGAFLLFNFWYETTPTSFTYVINGHTNTAAWPYPDTQTFEERTIALPIQLNQLVTGPNTISINSDQMMEVGNININLPNAGGIVLPPSH